MKKTTNLLLFIPFLFLVVSCSTSTEQNNPDTKTEQTQSAITPMPKVSYHPPSVDRSDETQPEGSPFVATLLQEIFPLDAGGLNRFSAANGAPKLAEGLIGSHSRMVYKNQNQDSEITLNVFDSGINGQTMDQIISWMKLPKNTETEKLTEKTGALKGFPSYTLYRKDNQIGEIHLLVNKRFEVVANGVGVPLETLQKVVEDWDLKSLY